MLDIKQAESHITNRELNIKAGAVPINIKISRRQMSFIGHCLRMPKDEPANIYALYRSEIKNTNRVGRAHKSYIAQISEYMGCKDEVVLKAEEIVRAAKDDKGVTWKRRYCESSLKEDDVLKKKSLKKGVAR